jgi:exonuclease III
MFFPGVVTYVKDKLLPLDARADWLVTQDDDSDDEASTADLCKEGRIMYTDHGSFVLLNVYVPNAGGQIGQPRMDFKLRYLKALQKTCEMTITEQYLKRNEET